MVIKEITAYKANDGTLFNTYDECLEYETKDYPKIEGYTCYGECYLSNTIIENKTWKEAMELKETVVFPNGKTVIAHTLSKEELETTPFAKRRRYEKAYWTSTPYEPWGDNHHWCVGGNSCFYFCLDTRAISVCLGFKNPFLN